MTVPSGPSTGASTPNGHNGHTINSMGMGRLHHKNAIVTGAAGGIGLETCILFAKEGANVLMADISKPALEKAAAKVKELVPSHHKVEIQV
jgi:NADP-dependent 3-hydroxy acid dehydrogenase YdfG